MESIGFSARKRGVLRRPAHRTSGLPPRASAARRGTFRQLPHADGFILTEWGRWPTAKVLPALERALAVGARHFTLLVELTQAAATDAAPRFSFADAGTPLAAGHQGARLRELARWARERGATVGLVPLLQWDGGGRQWLWPRAAEAWLERYAQLVRELASFATSIQATELVVGSELTCLFPYAASWRALIASVRREFGGHLTLSPTALDFATVRFWDALDSVGVSAYFPLAPARGVRSVGALTAAWWAHRAHLEAFAALRRKPLTFVELGYPSTEVAALKPWDYRFRERTLDLELQERCFRAFANVWSDARHLRAFRLWGLESNLDPNGKTHSPLGKPAEAAVSALFARRDRR
jgi:hypothetical protein